MLHSVLYTKRQIFEGLGGRLCKSLTHNNNQPIISLQKKEQ
jgi:hypothetical protein